MPWSANFHQNTLKENTGKIIAVFLDEESNVIVSITEERIDISNDAQMEDFKRKAIEMLESELSRKRKYAEYNNSISIFLNS